MPRLIFLSNHGIYAQTLARYLEERGIAFDAVVVHIERPPAQGKGALVWARLVVARAWQQWKFRRGMKAFYNGLTKSALMVENLKSAEFERALSKLAPDYIIVGTPKIVPANIIAVAKEGAINAHPGLLPWARGSGVIGHSLEQGVPVGATVHYIDAGVDTGELIERRLLPVADGPQTLADLEKRADALRMEMLADVLERLDYSGERPVGITQTERFPLYRWPDAKGRQAHDALAQAGRAGELFMEWQSRDV